MKTKLLIIPVLFVMIIIMNSCEKDLDVAQKGVTSVSEFYKTDEDALEAAAAMYNAWRANAYTSFFVKNLLSDDMICGGGSRGDNTSYEQINEFQFMASNSTLASFFANYYTIIYRANLITANVSADTDVKKRVIAEAKVARAYCYFNLVTLWGPVPLVTQPLSPAEAQQPNGDVDDIWAQIEQDLNDAIDSEMLPEKSSPTDQTPGARLTNQAAIAFLGKAQLFEGKYEEAATTLKKVINSGEYELYSDYSNIMRTVADFCPENIFELNVLNDGENPWIQGTTIFALMVNYRSDHMNMYGYFWGLHELWYNGWGFANPTASLYNAFVDEETASGYRLKNTIKTYAEISGMSMTINSGSNLYGHEGYFGWKFRFPGSEVISNSYGYASSSNFRVMRYAEVLLLAAEASFMSGDETSALDYINQIRTRAQLASLSSLTLEDIKQEKRLELCYEECRYQDLIRWGDAATVLADKGKEIHSFYGFNADFSLNVQVSNTNATYGFKTGKHELLPFPEHEITVNQNITQNPGW